MKGAVIGGIGFIAGAVISFIFTKSHYEKLANEEISKTIEHYENKAKPKEESDKKDIPIKQEDTVSFEVKTPKYTNYSSYSKSTAGKEDRVMRTPDTVSLIDANSFANEEPWYDKVTLMFFTEAHQLVDMDGEEVSIDTTVTEECLNAFREGSNDTIYIRNDSLKIDYEVIAEYDDGDRIKDDYSDIY